MVKTLYCDEVFTFLHDYSTASVLMQGTSRVKDRTTSDLDSVFSSSWPMSIMEVLCPRFIFWSLNSPPLDTGMLSRLAISWFTEDLSSSMYMASISLDTNLGNLPPCWQNRRRFSTEPKPWCQEVNDSASKIQVIIRYGYLIKCKRYKINVGKYASYKKAVCSLVGGNSHLLPHHIRDILSIPQSILETILSPPQTLTHPGNLVRHLKTTIQLPPDLCSLLIQVVQLLINTEEEVNEVAMLEYSQGPGARVKGQPHLPATFISPPYAYNTWILISLYFLLVTYNDIF